MVYANRPNTTREHQFLLLGGFLTRAYNIDESWNDFKSFDNILNYLPERGYYLFPRWINEFLLTSIAYW